MVPAAVPVTYPTLSVESAQERILRDIGRLGAETVSVLDAAGRVAAETVLAVRHQPPRDNSAMDGYAVRWDDVKDMGDEGRTLTVVETIAAGGMPEHALGPGQAARIMTGAPVPDGADLVVMREWAESADGQVRIERRGEPRDNIRPAGEDVARGSVVVEAGQTIDAGTLGLIVGQGHARISVVRRPVVGILPTGDEIQEPGTELPEGHIFSSNSYALAALVREAGGVPKMLGIARDDRDSLRAAFASARGCDALVTIGGVSVGDFDYVKSVLEEMGATRSFWKVAMRPGKPNAFGFLDGMPYFGLPGNPVSAMVSFLQYVRPALATMLGRPDRFLPTVDAVIDHDLRSRKRFLFFYRGVLRWDSEAGTYRVRTTGPQGSGILRSMAAANGLVVVPEDIDQVTAGDRVRVQLLPGDRGRSDAGLR